MTARLRAVPDSASVTLSAAVGAYLDTMPHAEQARTRAAYAATLKRVAASLGPGTDLALITGEQLAAWMSEAHGANAPATWNRARDVLRSAWWHWSEWRWVAEHDETSWPVKPRIVRQQAPRAIPAADIARLLGDKALHIRERTLWTMLSETAARIGEVLALNAEDLDMPNRRATVTGKGNRVREITWGSDTALLLPRMLKGRRTGPLFATLRKAPAGTPVRDLTPGGYGRLSVRTAEAVFAVKAATLPGTRRTLHGFRHAKLTEMGGMGLSQDMLRVKSGHSSSKSLAIYNRPGTDALQAWEADHDPKRRR